MFDRLAGKVAFITGSSAGIGAATARIFARYNAKLVLTARRYENLVALKSSILEQVNDKGRRNFFLNPNPRSNPGAQIHIAKMDVTNPQQIKEAIDSIPASFGGQIDVLVNNAGLALGVDPVESVTQDTFNAMMDTNVRGLLLVTQAILPIMKQNKNGGHIVNISSVAGTQAYPLGSIYCASKHAVQAISNSLRMELVASPIKVSTISPGLVETEFSQIRFKGDKDRAKSVYKGLTPLTAEDVAETIAFTVSRREHVQIADILIFPNNQAAATVVHRDHQ